MKRLTSFIILGILLSVPINGQSMTKIKAPEFPEYADWLNTERAKLEQRMVSKQRLMSLVDSPMQMVSSILLIQIII